MNIYETVFSFIAVIVGAISFILFLSAMIILPFYSLYKKRKFDNKDISPSSPETSFQSLYQDSQSSVSFQFSKEGEGSTVD